MTTRDALFSELRKLGRNNTWKLEYWSLDCLTDPQEYPIIFIAVANSCATGWSYKGPHTFAMFITDEVKNVDMLTQLKGRVRQPDAEKLNYSLKVHDKLHFFQGTRYI